MTYVLSNGKMIGVYIKEGRKASNALILIFKKINAHWLKLCIAIYFGDCVLPKPAVPR